ncbi:hypothetical protein [Bacillus sp. REN10]|uniref:hypothetical protein n=1 Tax=Bacillus sp. REN10 TaxID=2782541 RepID=UPI00193BDF36|nr:hypothetical protein [Bacillus sp. REN10]
MKVLVGKEEYEQVRMAEKTTGKKIKHLTMIVPDCINGVWGVYQVIRCYKSVSKYYAEMKLLERAENEAEAHLKVVKVTVELRQR